MDFQWILLAFFLIAVISGVMKALKRDMLKNLLMLASVVVAFFITFFLQLGGTFQGITTAIAEIFDLTKILGDFAIAEPVLVAIGATVASTFMFVTVFSVLLLILRILVHILLMIFVKKADSTVAEAKADAEVKADAEADSEAEEDTDAEAKAEANDEADAGAEVLESAEAPVEKKKKKRKPIFYKEELWKRIVSVSSGVIGGILTLSVLLMPIFYLMGVASTATHATDGLDADDSKIYKVAEVVDAYVVAPYEKSFVGAFYDGVALSDLMSYTAKLGGKIELADGNTAYADDTLKNVVSHGVSAMTQITSAKSKCATVRTDVNAIVSDPVVSSLAADLLTELLHGMEIEAVEEDDLLGGLVNNFLEYYKAADKATIQKDLLTVGNTAGVLAEEQILGRLLSESMKIEELLEHKETLGDIVEAISGLSAFGPTLEGAFELGVDIMGETLKIPATDAEAYESFMEDLLTQMQKTSSTSFDINTIRYYIVKCQQNGVKVSSSNGIKGHSQFVAYVAHWERVQSAFSHASEDKSYGYFTIEINGQWYVYDKNEKYIYLFDEAHSADYKDKASPVAGLINALTLYSTEKRLTRDNLYTILTSYTASATDTVSVALANRILAKDAFTSNAVTVEKMLAATDFKDWSDADKAKDSRLCVDIIVDLLSLMDHLASLDGLQGVEEAADLLGEFTLLGEIMDTMKETSCISGLPALLIEGVVKNEAFTAFLKPSTAFQINNIVENNNKTYAECMDQIAGILKWAINSLGGSLGG